MCDQTEISYSDGEVVWVKLGNCWWPGEVVTPDKLSPDVLGSYRKPPIVIVKFFQEDAYEFVKNISSVYKYQCSRKHEFINKGLSLYRTKHGHMEKFPEDVIRAETKVGGDLQILDRDEFQETKKESYAGLFGTPAKKTPGSMKKGRGRPPSESPKISTPVRRMKEKTDYRVHILVQGSKPVASTTTLATPAEPPTPSTSAAEGTLTDDTSTQHKPDNLDTPVSTVNTPATPSTPSSSSGIYACHACSFTTTRLNVLILHNKSHSVSFVPYTPSPIKKKLPPKSLAKSTPSTSKPRKERKPRKEKTDKPVEVGNKKRSFEDKASEVESKKLKTDEEIKSSLLADWDDDSEDESNDESATAAAQSPEGPLGAQAPEGPLGAQAPEGPLDAQSPEGPIGAQSPEGPLGAQSPKRPLGAQAPDAPLPAEAAADLSPVLDNKTYTPPYTEKPEVSSDSNKYEFCEDEDWPVEADAGRKIPRVKNPVRTEETKSISIDEDDMAREVAELLNKTAVPELPTVPEPLKVEENFPEPSVVKSPDKKLDRLSGATPDGGVPEIPPTKAIFKTKTFFRSRHSRSQDAIGKYVAEQLNNVEKMDIADSDLNGSDNVSSPEARESPPIEHVKIARLAPKIQLKKMKAEAQLREQERNRFEPSVDPYNLLSDIMGLHEKPDSPHKDLKKEENETTKSLSNSSENVLYPISEIIPVSEVGHTTQEINEVPDTNYDASTEGEDTCESTIDANHQVTEESQSNQETYGMEIDHDEIERTESNQEIAEVVVEGSESNHEIVELQESESNQEIVEQLIPFSDSHQEGVEEVAQNTESKQKIVEEIIPDSDSNQETVQVVPDSDSNQEVGADSDSNQDVLEVVPHSKLLYQENRNKSIEIPGMKVPEQMLSDTPEPTDSYIEEDKPEQPAETYINETTVSAVDALLSVSREADRVTRTISDDPPEDLFEDDNRDESIDSNINGDTNDIIMTENESEQIMYSEKEQDVAEGMDKELDQIKLSANEQHPTEPTILEESVKNVCPENGDETSSYFSIHDETDRSMVPETEEEIPITNDGTDESRLPTNIQEIATIREESDKKIYEAPPESLTTHEEFNKDVYPVSNKIPALQEHSNKSVFFDNGIHQKSEDMVFTGNELHIPETHEEQVMIHSGFSENEEEIITTQESEIIMDESVYMQNEEDIPAVLDETEIPIDDNPDEYITSSEMYQNEEVVTTPHNIESPDKQAETVESTVENVPSESDLQIAEALINLPATALQSKTLTENIEMTSSFELQNIQEEIVHASEEKTVFLKKATGSTNKLNPNDESVVRFETEQEKCENLNAAQSLLHMSESIEHTISISESMDTNDISEPVVNAKQNNGIDNSIEQNMAKISAEMINEPEKIRKPFITSSSKLLQILEEPSKPRLTATKVTPAKQIVMRGKEKILNFDVAKSSFKNKPHSSNQKIIIRRTTPSKPILNNISEIPSQDKIILSRSNPSQEGSIQRFTIQTTPDAPSDANTIIIQQKIRKLSKPHTKIQKIKQQTSLIALGEVKPVAEPAPIDNAMFDINSMPIVLSEDLITAESIEKMQVVMSDANISPAITQPQQPLKHTKPKIIVTENEKITVTSMPKKQEVKSTLLMNSVSEVQNKSATPNILSKSAKLRAAKPMLVIDKTTGKQKIIMTKAETSIKDVKKIQKIPTMIQKNPTLAHKTQTLLQKTPTLVQKTPTLVQKTPTLLQKTHTFVQKAPTLIQKAPTLVQKTTSLLQTTPTLIQTTPTLIQAAPQSTKQSSQTEKFIILPTQNVARPNRTQKIVIDPQTGKAHMILSRSKESSPTIADNKPVSAKLVPSKSEANTSGNTVMIITNAQGAQSRIVLTPEHERILFPNKQQQKGSQLKTIAHRITTASALPQLKTVINPLPMRQIVTTTKTPTRIVPKQKNAIITSKGQLIVGGRVATTAQNIAPMPEIRHVSKRLSQTEPRKLVQAIQKTNSEPIIYLQQKSGAVMQLTTSQFEQLQRSGQIVQKAPAQPAQERVIIQKSRTIVEAGSGQKPRARKAAVQAPVPSKRAKHQHEIAIAPAPAAARRSPLLPALAPLVAPHSPPVTFAKPPSGSTPVTSSSTYAAYDNFEEMLPSTAIARQPETTAASPEALPEASPPLEPAAAAGEVAPEQAGAALADGQLLAVPGEHFGGPVGSFYLCVEEQGTYTPIDNRPLVLENNQLVPMAEVAVQPERRDILSAALANSEVFHADAGDVPDAGPDFRDLNANVSVHCRVSETSTTLHQPIMTAQEQPRCSGAEVAAAGSLEDTLAAIGVSAHAVPTSLELPITVTDPRIATRGVQPLAGAGYGTTLMPSPAAELCYVSAEESAGSISMPLLTEDETPALAGGKSMPILTDEVGERAVSSVESALDAEESAPVTWTRRLLTPASDTEDLSVEIPLQPTLQLSIGDLAEHT